MEKKEEKLMQEELLQMNQSVFVPEDSGTTDAPSTDAATTDAPDEGTTDAPSTDSASTDAVSTDAPTTDAPDEITLLRQEIELLKAEKGKKVTTDAPSTSAPTTDVPFTNEDFLGNIDLDDPTRDPEKFNELLNSVLKKGMDLARGITTKGNENVLKSIPDIVKSNIAIVTNLKKASDKFYADNKDLKPWKQAVASVFEEIAAKNPDKTIEENLNIVGDEVRSRLKLKKEAIDQNKKKNPPKLPGNKGSKRGNTKPETEGIAAEIEAMNKSI